MKSTDDQGLIPVIVASEADSTYIRTIPTAQPATRDGSVSLDLGLPPECATSVAAGGKRPEMKDINGIWNLFSRAIQSLQAYRGVYDSSFATAIGGYPKNAMVSDSSGNFWVSTADQNTTVPGAGGANWQSLFNGYATQAWANGQFLQLALATLQAVTGPVAFGGQTTVPDVSVFTGKDALNALTAEGRYAQLSMLPLRGMAVFTESTTWVVPDGVTRVRFEVYGGGGSGGSSPYSQLGGGGGAGGSCIGLVAVVPGDEITIKIGAGGASVGALNNGNAGGTTSFGTFGSATGGSGGTAGVNNTNGGGGAGGVGVGGIINGTGAPGHFGIGGIGTGIGASTTYGGGGGEGYGSNIIGNAGSGWGAGGSGGPIGAPSGAGADGGVLLEY